MLEVGGGAHRAQLGVLRAAGRRGRGSALVRAALQEAARRGYASVTLRTDADVPSSAPSAAALGFVESEPDTDPLRALIGAEAGLERSGRRVRTTASIRVPGPR